MLPSLTFLLSDPVTLEAHPCDGVVPQVEMVTTRRRLMSGLMAALKALTASFRRQRVFSWDIADTRTQERDPLGELTRRLTLPPLGF